MKELKEMDELLKSTPIEVREKYYKMIDLLGKQLLHLDARYKKVKESRDYWSNKAENYSIKKHLLMSNNIFKRILLAIKKEY